MELSWKWAIKTKRQIIKEGGLILKLLGGNSVGNAVNYNLSSDNEDTNKNYKDKLKLAIGLDILSNKKRLYF